MLTDEEKDRIRAEEVFRHEVRQQLLEQKKRSVWEKRWEYLNSSLFIWFLSTILLGTASFLYTRWDRAREDERRNQEQAQITIREKESTIKKLDIEISNRLNFANTVLSPHHYSRNIIRVIQIFQFLDRPTEVKSPASVFQEYSNRNLQSLIWELLQLVPESEKKEIELALTASRQLYSIAATKVSGMSEPAPVPVVPTEIRKWATNFINFQLLVEQAKSDLNLKAFNLHRWGNPIEFFPVESKLDFIHHAA